MVLGIVERGSREGDTVMQRFATMDITPERRRSGPQGGVIARGAT